jgi:hypothetical protein
MLPPEKLSPVTLDDLDNVPSGKTYKAEVRRFNAERRHKLGHQLICASVIPGLIALAAREDQMTASPLTWGINTAEIHQMAANEYSTDGTGTLAITLPGLGVRDSGPTIAWPLRESLTDTIPNSKLLALEEGSFLHIDNTIQTVYEAVRENNPGHLILYGMSTGGKEMLYVMAALREAFPDLKVTLIADSSPFTGDTAYELRDDPDLIAFGEYISDLQLYGGPATNSLIDMYLSSDTRAKYITKQGIDPAAHQAEWERIGRDIWNHDGTSTALRIGQLGLVAGNKMEDQLTEIAADNPDLPPITFIYIANSNDHTVDVEKAIAGYRAICNALDIRFVVKRQDGLPHASENDFPEQYNQTITIALEEEAYFEYQRAKYLQSIENDQKAKRVVGSMRPR